MRRCSRSTSPPTGSTGASITRSPPRMTRRLGAPGSAKRMGATSFCIRGTSDIVVIPDPSFGPGSPQAVPRIAIHRGGRSFARATPTGNRRNRTIRCPTMRYRAVLVDHTLVLVGADTMYRPDGAAHRDVRSTPKVGPTSSSSSREAPSILHKAHTQATTERSPKPVDIRVVHRSGQPLGRQVRFPARRRAASILAFSTNATGVVPVSLREIRAKLLSLMPRARGQDGYGQIVLQIRSAARAIWTLWGGWRPLRCASSSFPGFSRVGWMRSTPCRPG